MSGPQSFVEQKLRIEALERQLTALQARNNHTRETQRKLLAGLEEQSKQLAAAQLRERELRELICQIDFTWQGRLKEKAKNLLARPLDDSALVKLEAGYQARMAHVMTTINQCYQMLLSESNTVAALTKAENFLREIHAESTTPTEALDRYVAEKVAQAKNDAYKEDGLIIDHLKKEHAEQVKHQWRCFHCNEVFIDQKSATEHFGTSQFQAAACQIDIAEYRRMEEVNRRHLEDDTDLHRALHQAVIDGDQKAQKAEEEGYAKGLKAGMAEQVKTLRVNIDVNTFDGFIVRYSGKVVDRLSDSVFCEHNATCFNIPLEESVLPQQVKDMASDYREQVKKGNSK